MRTLITNGTIVTADGSYAGRRPGRRRDDRPDRRATWPATGVTADETIDAAGKYVIPGGDRRPHPHGAAVRRHVRQGHVRDRHAGGGVRRDDHRSSTSRSSRRAKSLREGLDAWHAKAEGNAVIDYGFHMIMSDVNDDIARRDGRAGRRGRPRLQAVHRLPGRLLQRRRGDLPGDAADREERRADHDARRERAWPSTSSPADLVAAGTTDPVLPRPRPQPDLRGRGDQPGHPPGRGGRRARLHRPPLGARRARRGPRRPATAAPKAFAETCPQYLFLSLDDLATGSRARSSSARRRCAPKDHQDELWTGLVKDDLQVVSTDHCPFDFHGQKELGRGDFRKIPNGLPGVEDRVDLLHDGGVVAGRITPRALGRDHLDGAGQAVRDVPAEGRDRGRLRRRPRRSTTRTATHTISARRPTTWTSTTRATRAARSRAGRDIVLSRGSVVVRDGEFTGRKGDGRFLKRRPPTTPGSAEPGRRCRATSGRRRHDGRLGGAGAPGDHGRRGPPRRGPAFVRALAASVDADEGRRRTSSRRSTSRLQRDRPWLPAAPGEIELEGVGGRRCDRRPAARYRPAVRSPVRARAAT